MVDNDDKIKEQLKQQIKPVIDNMVSALSERKPKDTVHPYTSNITITVIGFIYD